MLHLALHLVGHLPHLTGKGIRAGAHQANDRCQHNHLLHQKPPGWYKWIEYLRNDILLIPHLNLLLNLRPVGIGLSDIPRKIR